jgi:serine/threonine protein kinase
LERLTPFGKYYLLERINVGGMAEVFKAKTVGVEGFEKLVAIKRILPSVAEDEEFIKMFIDEAKITSQLSHANLAQTFDLGKIADAYYIAMEYVPGKDLRAVQERLRRRGERIPLAIAAYVVGRVCEGLDYAHRKRDSAGRELNIVHRDVSPQNVIVSFEGEVKLVDFGIAKAANKITKTQAGILKGKFGYMSPEQVRGLPLDRRSDIFAAGVVLYELCTGERLFTGSSDFSVLEKVQQARITPPSRLVPDLPVRLENVILRALAREPESRYQHAADLAQDLQRWLIEAQPRSISRDDVALFMKSTFPEDDARERESAAEALDPTRTRAPRKGPPPLPEDRGLATPERIGPLSPSSDPGDTRPELRRERPRNTEAPTPVSPLRAVPGKQGSRPPPRLPASLTEGLSGPPEPPPAQGNPALPPLPTLPPLRGPGEGPPISPAQLVRASELSTERTDPGGRPEPEPEEEPTRPMSMAELAAAERQFAEKEKQLARGEARPRTDPPGTGLPGSPGVASVRDPGAAAPRASGPPSGRLSEPTGQRAQPAAAPREAPPSVPVVSSSRQPSKPPPLPASLFDNVPLDETPPPALTGPVLLGDESPPAYDDRTDPHGARGGEPRRPATPRPGSTRPRTQEKLAPFGGRMAVGRPTLVGEDATDPNERTGESEPQQRARWARRGQAALLVVALGVLLWAWLSLWHKQEPPPSTPTASLVVTTEPEDAQVLLDGAQVKDPLDRGYTEPGLSAGVQHVLTVRRDGFAEQVSQLTLQAAEQKVLLVKLQPLPGQLTVRSTPSGAQVFLDGQKVGLTPAYLPEVKQGQSHAIVLEKHCFRTWQVAVPANAGRREVAATLEPVPGACPGQRQEREERPPAPELPLGNPAAMASLGFLSLGSRPSANVVIDGVDIGRTTPIVQWPLKVGKHRVRLVVASKKKEITVDVRSGQTVNEIVDLRKK